MKRMLAAIAILALSVGLPGTIAHAASPVVSNILTEVTAEKQVNITFTLADADGDECWIFPFAHNTETNEYIPITCFLSEDGQSLVWLNDLAARQYAPGTHTITWLPGADWGTRDFGQNIVVYVRADDKQRCAPGRFMIIDLAAGADAESYPHEIKHFVDVRDDSFKTTKLVLRELPDGSWAGVYEVTQKQYELVTGLTPSNFSGNPMRPVEKVSWNNIKDAGGFLARLRARTGLSDVDLPLDAQWEYAGRAGAAFKYNDYTQDRGKGTDAIATLANLGWYGLNSGESTRNVGTKQANAWGLYDVHGNVWEWTLEERDAYKVIRGGAWDLSADYCPLSYKGDYGPASVGRAYGFRIFRPAPID